MKKTSLEILQDLETKTIMICHRNAGMIAPTSMRFMPFQEAISEIYIHAYTYRGKVNYSFRSAGFYVFENGKVKNIHSLLRKLLRENVLVLQTDESDPYKRKRMVIR